MSILIPLVEWFFVVLVFSSVVGAVKLFIKKKKCKSFVLKTGLVCWIIAGATIFFILFSHANNGQWLWTRTPNYPEPIQKGFSYTKEVLSVGGDSLSEAPYTNHDYKFSIIFPRDWVAKNPISSQSIIIKAINRKADGRFAAINIYVYKVDKSINFASSTAEDFFGLLYGTEHELLASGETRIDGERTLWMRSNFIFPSITYVLARDNIVFSLYGCTTGEENWFEENEEMLKSSIRTFRFID